MGLQVDMMKHQPEIATYLAKAHDALQQARDNLAMGHYGVVITRGYYAMFYAASSLLASINISRSKHSSIQAAFGEYFVKTGLIEIEYSRMLGFAFNARLDSDYDAFFTAEPQLAQDILQSAILFVKRTEDFLRDEKGYDDFQGR
jgi:uncharacterized protein (UPF0332 family)